MAMQKQDDQHEHTFSNYVRIQDVVLKTCLRRWTIGKCGERGSGISVLPARHDYYYYYYYYYIFSHQLLLVVFYWSLSDSKSPQISRTLLNILAILNNAVVWMVSTRLPTSKFYYYYYDYYYYLSVSIISFFCYFNIATITRKKSKISVNSEWREGVMLN